MGVEPLQVGGGSCAAGGGGAAGGQVEAAQVGSQLEGDGGGGRGRLHSVQVDDGGGPPAMFSL